MAVIQEKNKKKWTNDGRSWYYTYSFIDEYGNRQRSRSKLYKTKKEAKEEEAINILRSCFGLVFVKNNVFLS
ncbi:MAG: Arm DNA-binding domain-containing protein [Bacilli bacterium]|nr:Arm DNA-binding domain-containing protein [Bacilli bacterium]